MYLKVGMQEADKYDVIDMNTGIGIPGVQEVNDETGDISIFLRDNTGEIIFDEIKGDFPMFHFKGNIKLIKKGV